MNTPEHKTPARAYEYGEGISTDELHAAIRAGEQLRAETMHRAIVSAFRFLWQAPSRLFSAGTHRHA